MADLGRAREFEFPRAFKSCVLSSPGGREKETNLGSGEGEEGGHRTEEPGKGGSHRREKEK